MRGYIAFLSLMLIGAAIAVGCTARMPFDAVVSATPINGQILVTVVNGLSPTAGVNVQVVNPNGATQVEATSYTAATVGQAVFKESTAGTYQVSLAGSLSLASSVLAVKLTPAQPYQSVQIQLNPAYFATLAVTPADGKPSSYDETLSYHTFNVAYHNPANTQQNVILSYNVANLPSGWQVYIANPGLQQGQSTQVQVSTQPYTVAGNVTVTVTAVSNSIVMATIPIILSQHWAPQLVRNYGGAPVNYNGAGCSDTLTYNCRNCTNLGTTATIVIQTELSGVNTLPAITAVLTDGIPQEVLNSSDNFVDQCGDTLGIAFTLGTFAAPYITDPNGCSSYTLTSTWY